jgi:hypothetical protein
VIRAKILERIHNPVFSKSCRINKKIAVVIYLTLALILDYSSSK